MCIASLAELIEHHKSGGIRTLTARHASIHCGYNQRSADFIAIFSSAHQGRF
jgi:hypothetical protein